MSVIAQPLLEQIAAAPGGEATRRDLAALLSRAPNLITGAALILRRRKLVEFPQRGVYRITEAGRNWLAEGQNFASRNGTRRGGRTRGLRARAWWVMRELRKFTVADLLDRLADGSERDPAGNLLTYLGSLEKVGIVKRMARRVPGTAPESRGHVVWWLARDVGRQAPIRRKAGGIYDPNHREFLVPTTAEVCDA